MRYGDTGWRVRVLQSRLHQLGLHSEVITSRFDAATRAGVRTFQARRAWEVTGRVDKRTWRKLVAVTEKPTTEALHNVYTPGPAILKPGDSGWKVRQLQARLKQVRWYDGKVTGDYGDSTVAAVKGFQKKRRIPVTGEVDRRTLDRLHAMTREPTKAELFNIVPSGPRLDPRCTTGRVLCIDKTSRSLRWVVDGKVLEGFDVRFGSDELPTREGSFAVYRKSRDHVSSLYDTPMPYAMFFSGGQAVHYSPDFAATGYNGASHGCVNVRDYAGIRWLFDRVRIGDRVIIYWS
ncbi:murein L,D-transpeptidase [Nocardioides gansuensis]|uniref:Murein L,D-transpeptidase n=2 Tax=Nocardioides gansuensis TaxID=2138300 RepID=A0A2T8FA35_9ACTN|nr:murein L,D-transpeptidase [Nocardioides gansuensis]